MRLNRVLFHAGKCHFSPASALPSGWTDTTLVYSSTDQMSGIFYCLCFKLASHVPACCLVLSLSLYSPASPLPSSSLSSPCFEEVHHWSPWKQLLIATGGQRRGLKANKQKKRDAHRSIKDELSFRSDDNINVQTKMKKSRRAFARNNDGGL